MNTKTVDQIADQIATVLARHDAAVAQAMEACRRALSTFRETASFDPVVAAALAQVGELMP